MIKKLYSEIPFEKNTQSDFTKTIQPNPTATTPKLQPDRLTHF
jgi:hypothetical protein